jgi:hypothetical protein
VLRGPLLSGELPQPRWWRFGPALAGSQMPAGPGGRDDHRVREQIVQLAARSGSGISRPRSRVRREELGHVHRYWDGSDYCDHCACYPSAAQTCLTRSPPIAGALSRRLPAQVRGRRCDISSRLQDGYPRPGHGPCSAATVHFPPVRLERQRAGSSAVDGWASAGRRLGAPCKLERRDIEHVDFLVRQAAEMAADGHRAAAGAVAGPSHRRCR